MKPASNPITPEGLAALKARYDHLLGTERPAIVEIVSWAAGNGDRSENGDYLYGRKRMREIDRELAWRGTIAGGSLLASVYWRSDPGHYASLPDDFGLGFTWAKGF